MKHTFKCFIVEGASFDMNAFFKSCEPFLNEIKGISEARLPLHGTNSARPLWQIKKFVERAGPRHTPRDIHFMIDEYFKQRFGWAARSEAIFTTGSFNVAKYFGPPCLIFPIGYKFKTLWSPDVIDIYDMYTELRNKVTNNRQEQLLKSSPGGEELELTPAERKRAESEIAEKLLAMIKNSRWYYNAEIKRGYESRNEVMLNCEKAYLINFEKWTSLNDELLLELRQRKIIT